MSALLFVFYKSLLLVFLISYFFAYMFEPLIRKLEKKKVSRTISVVIIWALMVLVLVLIVLPLILSLLQEVGTLQEKIGTYSQNFKDTIDKISNSKQTVIVYDFLQKINVSQGDIVNFIMDKFKDFIQYSGSMISNNISKFISSFMWVFTLPVITFYFMLDFKKIVSVLMDWELPGKGKAMKIVIQIEKEISKFFRGQLVICIILGFLMGIGFFIIGVDFPLLLGVLAGISNLVPYLGVIVSTVIAILFSILKLGFTMELLIAIIKIIILVMIVQAVDGFLLSPKILSSTLDLSPVFVILFLIAGGMYGGIIGMFLSIPFLIVVKVLFKNVKIKFT